MRGRAWWWWVAVAGLALGCGPVGSDPGSGALVVSVAGAARVAFQDGDGPWRSLELSDGDHRLPVADPEGRYGLLRWYGRQAVVTQTTLAEEPRSWTGGAVHQPPPRARLRVRATGIDPAWASWRLEVAVLLDSATLGPGAEEATLEVPPGDTLTVAAALAVGTDGPPSRVLLWRVPVTELGEAVSLDLRQALPVRLREVPLVARGVEALTTCTRIEPMLLDLGCRPGTVGALPPSELMSGQEQSWVTVAELGRTGGRDVGQLVEGTAEPAPMALPPGLRATLGREASGRPWIGWDPLETADHGLNMVLRVGPWELWARLSPGWRAGRTRYPSPQPWWNLASLEDRGAGAWQVYAPMASDGSAGAWREGPIGPR